VLLITLSEMDLCIKENELGGLCSMHGRDENSYRILLRKTERCFWRPTRRWADSIKMHLELDVGTCIGFAWLMIG